MITNLIILFYVATRKQTQKSHGFHYL